MICCCVLVTMRTVAECVCGVGRLILDGKVVVGTFALSFVRCGRFCGLLRCLFSWILDRCFCG